MRRTSPRDRARRAAPGGKVVLLPGRDKSARNRHPWVFSGSIEALADDVPDGGVADVLSASGEFLARGFVNRKSQITVRLLTWDADEPIDADFFRARIRRAAGARASSGTAGARASGGAARIVNAESDFLPGLVVDRYGDYWVLQASTLGMARRMSEIVASLSDAAGARNVYERSEGEGRDKEGLESAVGLLLGEEPPDVVRVAERTWDDRTVVLGVDVLRGHKTGAYLDQSDNRRVVAALARGAEVLNLFSYTGAFALHAAQAGAAHITNVDSSAEALSLSEAMAAENGVADRVEHTRADVFDAVRKLRSEGRTFDLVIADPPKFARSAGQVDKAARGYKDLNRLAFELVRPGGHLATFSCSGLVSSDLFQKIVWSASLEAKKDAQLVRRLTQAADHPVLLSYPEGEYLKGMVCRVY